ncbi:MAG: HAD-IA family hydrolase [Candidatus Omnitrophica bacterium]|jgi:HAD superfamily hydrolase (TIGR01549 family)|nr:HAD-IA family hydrolase [Candidatus Omnitrophota bacterium]
MNIDLLLFDIDGTILDSSEDIAMAANITLEKFGYEKQSKSQIIGCVGNGIDAFMGCMVKHATPACLEKLKSAFSQALEDQKDRNAIIYDGVREVLTFFKHKKKGVVTNRSHGFVMSTLKNTGLYQFFDFVSGVDAIEKVKPSPLAIENALEFFKIKKNKAMMIGDMDIDIQSGKNAGVYTCAVSYGLGSKEDLLLEKPDFFIDNIMELKKIIM